MFIGGSGGGGGGWGSQFSRGDRVVLISGKGIADSSNQANPVWGKNGDFIAAVVENTSGSSLMVIWDNGMRNLYDTDNSKFVLLQDAPKPANKILKKTVELDTTKLDPLILDAEIKTEIVALLQQHKHGNKLFEEWGLGEVIEYGRGMTLMFHGGPGTGKTFGARCIAKALNQELLVIGAAEIQSSEPGGANRAIQQAFAEADKNGKVLFIDECDSLIQNRANLGMILASEINTLLTEIEKFEGVLILATNRISDMDAALERRLSLIISFPNPNKAQREEIWKGLLPKKMPLGEGVNPEELAKHELTGGLIKNVVLQSARLALSDNADRVSLEHFTKAIARVKSSQGLMGKQRLQLEDGSVGVSVGSDKKKKMERFLNSSEE